MIGMLEFFSQRPWHERLVGDAWNALPHMHTYFGQRVRECLDAMTLRYVEEGSPPKHTLLASAGPLAIEAMHVHLDEVMETGEPIKTDRVCRWASTWLLHPTVPIPPDEREFLMRVLDVATSPKQRVFLGTVLTLPTRANTHRVGCVIGSKEAQFGVDTLNAAIQLRPNVVAMPSSLAIQRASGGIIYKSRNTNILDFCRREVWLK